MRQLVLITLLLLGRCAGVKRAVVRPDKAPPQLRQRPNFEGPHFQVETACVKKVEWYQGWCEDLPGGKPGDRVCHDVIINAPDSCVTVNAGGKHK